ncbi:MAG TPA: gamma-butyrobetaine hydroxylase-like domain-containing protein [Candidatus Binatia bacterium]|nr:gamma-butyrobetaine hydroxylase-like domain-containing protein [Candidatus Binatia bacterium]
MGERTHVERLKQVGRYALGVEWGDGHDSIIPHRAIRRACPCDACIGADRGAALPQPAEQPVRVELLGDESVFVAWADQHETVLLTEELRALCRCAHCAGEPEYPVSGR